MYFEEFTQERNLKKDTIKGYRTTINRYTRYYDMTFDDLINEAIDEETDNVDKRRRSIKTRFLQFRTHLLTETTLKQSTIKGHMKNLRTLYSHFEIELPKLPPVKAKDNEVLQTTYFDLPTKQQ